jgi:hypothetical protein
MEDVPDRLPWLVSAVTDADYGKREAAYIEKLRDALTVPVTSSPMPPIRPVASLTSASHSRGKALPLYILPNRCTGFIIETFII